MDNLSAPIQSKLLGVASWATLMTMQFFTHLLSLHSYCFNKEPIKWANTWSRKGRVTRFTSGSSLNATGKSMRLKWDHLRSFEIIWDHLRSCGQCFPVVFVLPAPRRWCAATRMAPSGACHHPAASRTDKFPSPRWPQCFLISPVRPIWPIRPIQQIPSRSFKCKPHD